MKFLVKPFRVFHFLGFYLFALVLSNLRVAYDALTPTHQMQPGIIEVPLDVKTDLEILAFSHLITMTPGTLSFSLSHDKTKLYVHAMYIDDAEALKREIKQNFEQRLLRIFR